MEIFRTYAYRRKKAKYIKIVHIEWLQVYKNIHVYVYTWKEIPQGYSVHKNVKDGGSWGGSVG